MVCCRLTPLQKSEVIKLVKSSPGRPVTAAIGDGGNDVSMIQEAHIGFGIMGREGRAAVRASDIAFAKFKHLKKAILVHGQWFYYRSSVMVQYFFYKNVACFTNQLFYAFSTNFSAESLFDDLNLPSYNMIYTALPIFLFSILARNFKEDTLINNPQLYQRNSNNSLLSAREVFIWFLQGLWHSVVIFHGWLLFWTRVAQSPQSHNAALSQKCFGLSVYITTLLVVSVKLLIQTRSISWHLVLSVILSFLIFLVINLVSHSLHLINDTVTDMMNVSLVLLSNLSVWTFILLLLVASLIPDVVIRVIRKHWKVILMKTRFKKKILDVNSDRARYQVSGAPGVMMESVSGTLEQ